MDNKFISIIIPCFNSEKTLHLAVESCLSQKNLTYLEIILVDDGSKDDTQRIILDYCKKYKNIRSCFHKENLGGGAARNTGFRLAKGEYLFCLDSDDILPPLTLSSMFKMIIEKKCDGVAIGKSIKFKGEDIHDIEVTDIFGYQGEKIPFISLFEKSTDQMCPLYYVFLFTKNAFEITKGYPEDNDFDTQEFAWRFLTNGLIAYTCPEAEYLHRIHFNESYYMRQYRTGKINYNWFKIFENYLFVFSNEAKEKILNFNLKATHRNIYDEISSMKNILGSRYDKVIIQNCISKYKKIIENDSQDFYDKYWLANIYFRESNYREALNILEKLRGSGIKNRALVLKIKMSKFGMIKRINFRTLENMFASNYSRSLIHPLALWHRAIKKLKHHV